MSKFNTTTSESMAGGGDATINLEEMETQRRLEIKRRDADFQEAFNRDDTAQQAYVGGEFVPTVDKAPEVQSFIDGLANITEEEILEANAVNSFKPGESEEELYRPNMRERQADKGPRRWNPSSPSLNGGSEGDGEFNFRVRDGVRKLSNGEFYLGVNPGGQIFGDAEKANITKGTNVDGVYVKGEGKRTSVDPNTQVRASQEPGMMAKPLVNALLKSGAIVFNEKANTQVSSEAYNRVMLAVTENSFAELAYLTTNESDSINQITGKPGKEEFTLTPQERFAADVKKTEPGGNADVTIAAGNAPLGRKIHAEYKRLNPDIEATELTQEEASTLGAAAKETYAELNPKMVMRIDGGGAGKTQSILRVTPNGIKRLLEGKQTRDNIFQKQTIKPLKAPTESGSIDSGDMANFTNVILGNVGQKQTQLLRAALKNAGSVGHVVDKRRSKIMLATLLGHLTQPDATTWESEIHGMGESKANEYMAKEKAEHSLLLSDGYIYDEAKTAWTKDGSADIPESYVYNAQRVMDTITMNYAQQVQSLAEARGQVNYLTFSALGYNHRILPQQTLFNPVTSKIVRAVTRSAKPAIVKPASRIEKNLRQMYAKTLLDKGDKMMPKERDIALRNASTELYAYGEILRSLQNVSDADYEAVSTAIASKIPMDTPEFPTQAAERIKGSMNLDPELHSDLIKKIKDQGQDGMVYIDGLIDHANYIDASKKGKTFHTYFNAYIDGMTNGIASNGVQMGSIETAMRTGVIRRNELTVLDDGDVRDQLEELSLASIPEGWGNYVDDTSSVDEIADHLSVLANELYTHRQLNKDTTMIYGYGMELYSFYVNFKDTINLKLEEGNANFQESFEFLMNHRNYNSNPPGSRGRIDDIAKTLNAKYSESLVKVMSSDGIDSRRLVRAGAGMFAAMDQMMVIDGPLGSKLAFGRSVSDGSADADTTQFNYYTPEGNKTRKAVHYSSTFTSAAERTIGDRKPEPGRWAYGGSLPGPIQSLDAATVISTYTGKSWNDISNAGKGSPYMFTIYDAFKMDANNYDVVLDEVNNNWMQTSLDYSYLQSVKDATTEMMKEYESNKASFLRQEANDPITKTEALYMKHLLQPVEASKNEKGKTYYNARRSTLVNRLKAMAPTTQPTDSEQATYWIKSMSHALRKVGYNYDPLSGSSVVPEVITYRQYYAFLDEFYKQMDFENQISKMISKTNKKKKILMELLQKQGFKSRSGRMIPLQYYT